MERVLEIGGYAAAYCGRLFAQAGADVLRIEQGQPPPAWASTAAMDAFLHAGKKRVQLDGAARLGPLAERADIVIVEAPGAAALADMQFDAWPTPVKVAITPFGRTGPKRNWQATPNVLLAMGGYTRIMGDADRAPLTLPGHYLEFQSGAFAYTAANAARLASRSMAFDIGMFEVVMALSQFTTVLWHCAGEIRQRHGSDFWSVAPSNLFRCRDGWVYINIVPAFWESFTVFLDQPELLLDERFGSNGGRMQHRETLHAIVASFMASRTRAEVDARAAECRVPVGVVQTFADVLDDPHLAARGFWQTLPGGECAGLLSPRGGFRIHGSAEPSLGTDEIEGLADTPANWRA